MATEPLNDEERLELEALRSMALCRQCSVTRRVVTTSNVIAEIVYNPTNGTVEYRKAKRDD